MKSLKVILSRLFLAFFNQNTTIMKGKDLHFISVIKRDGSGTINIEDSDNSRLDNESFKLTTLSLTMGTYIASGFNSYVVRKR